MRTSMKKAGEGEVATMGYVKVVCVVAINHLNRFAI